MSKSALVLVVVLAVIYCWMYSNRTENMSVLRYRPFMTGHPANINNLDNIAGIPYPNSYDVLPNINQYANDVAYGPESNYQMHGLQHIDDNDFDNGSGQFN